MNLRRSAGSTKYYDSCPTRATTAAKAFRDVELEAKILKARRNSGIGAQFGGK